VRWRRCHDDRFSATSERLPRGNEEDQTGGEREQTDNIQRGPTGRVVDETEDRHIRQRERGDEGVHQTEALAEVRLGVASGIAADNDQIQDEKTPARVQEPAALQMDSCLLMVRTGRSPNHSRITSWQRPAGQSQNALECVEIGPKHPLDVLACDYIWPAWSTLTEHGAVEHEHRRSPSR
jgi:hypothetical protein